MVRPRLRGRDSTVSRDAMLGEFVVEQAPTDPEATRRLGAVAV